MATVALTQIKLKNARKNDRVHIEGEIFKVIGHGEGCTRLYNPDTRGGFWLNGEFIVWCENAPEPELGKYENIACTD